MLYDCMLVVVDLGLIFLFALLASALLKLPTKPAVLLGWFLFSYANIVLICELAGTFFLLDNREAFLFGHASLTMIAWLLWRRAGRPSLLGPLSDWAVRLDRPIVMDSLKTYPELWILGAGVSAAHSIGAALILIMPPNNWDSMAYHLSRVGYWLQHASLFHWSTPNPRQTSFPMNAELGVLWTTLLSGTDHWVEFVQWVMVPVSMLAIVGLARLLGYSRQHSLFAALIWATLPMIVLQSTSTQNDLVVSAFFVSALYLLFLGHKTGQRGALVLSAIAFGLAMGTKSTMFLVLPGMGFVLLLLWLHKGRKQVLMWSAACLVAFALLGAYSFALNLLYYDSPLGPRDFVGQETRSDLSRTELLTVNPVRYAYQSVDLSGLPPRIASPLHTIKAHLADAVFSLVGFPIDSKSTIHQIPFDVYKQGPSLHEDRAWFGPLGMLLLMPVIVYQTYSGVRQKKLYHLGLALIFWSLVFVLSASTAWTPFKGRYFVLVVAITAPFLAVFFKARWLHRSAYWGGIILALFVVVWTATHNDSKPLAGQHAIWGKDTISRQARSNPAMEPVLRMVNQAVPQDATLGLLLNAGDWDYPFFGEEFHRTLVQVYPYARLDNTTWLTEQEIDFFLIHITFLPKDLPSHLKIIAHANGYYLVEMV